MVTVSYFTVTDMKKERENFWNSAHSPRWDGTRMLDQWGWMMKKRNKTQRQLVITHLQYMGWIEEFYQIFMHETHGICSSKLGQLYHIANQGRREDIRSDSWQKEKCAKLLLHDIECIYLCCSDVNGEFSFKMNEADGSRYYAAAVTVALMSRAMKAPGFNPVPVLCHRLKRAVSPVPPPISRASQGCKAPWGSGCLSHCLSGPKNILIQSQSKKETCANCSRVFKCTVERGWPCWVKRAC